MEYQSANCAPTCNSLTSCLLRSEWKKILSGNQGGPLTLKMIEVGLAPYIWLPTPYSFQAWWPWVKNYDGELRAGAVRPGPIYARIWVDQDLKRKMGFK